MRRGGRRRGAFPPAAAAAAAACSRGAAGCLPVCPPARPALRLPEAGGWSAQVRARASQRPVSASQLRIEESRVTDRTQMPNEARQGGAQPTGRAFLARMHTHALFQCFPGLFVIGISRQYAKVVPKPPPL